MTGVYWQPVFDPHRPVTLDWDAKLGNGDNGWGNQELEHYTADRANSFLYALSHPPPLPLSSDISRAPFLPALQQPLGKPLLSHVCVSCLHLTSSPHEPPKTAPAMASSSSALSRTRPPPTPTSASRRPASSAGRRKAATPGSRRPCCRCPAPTASGLQSGC